MEMIFKIISGVAVFAMLVAFSSAIGGGLVWVAFWLLHMVFSNIPQLTFVQSMIVGIVLGILGSFFKS